MEKRLEIRYDGKCPCMEIGKNGGLRHTHQVAWIIRADYKIAVCGNHIGNYRDVDQGDAIRMLRKKAKSKPKRARGRKS